MAVAPSSNQQHVPAWKRLGLKLKSHQPVDSLSESTALKNSTVEPVSKKRKAVDITGVPAPSHDGPVTTTAVTRSDGRKHANPQSEQRPLKRKKSVTFVDETKKEDGDVNERLLEDYVAQQQGGEDQFSKSEIAQFTAPAKVHPANQPPTKINGKTETDTNGSKKKQKDRKNRTDTSSQPQQDTAYVSYLKEYRSARATWKFNKNHQKKILDNLYNTYRLPFELDEVLSSYLSGLQGEGARKRLVDGAEKIISETNDVKDMPVPVNHEEAKANALRKQLKRTKGLLRDQEAAEQAYSDEHQEKLRKRKRATLVLQSLTAYSSLSTDGDQNGAVGRTQTGGDIEPPLKKKKTRRSKKMRSGVPDDDDTDETSSVSSVPSSTVSSSSEEEEDSSSDDDGSGSSSSSAASVSSDDDSNKNESDSETE